MENTLVQNIAFWGILAITSVLLGVLLIAVMAILKRKSTMPDGDQQAMDIKIGKAIIKRVDSLDDLIDSRRGKGEDESLLRQLKHFRNDLVGLLQNHSIEAFVLEKGTMLDASARKLIDIVDLDAKPKGKQEQTRIVEVIRLGYRYQKNLNSPSTIVRKPAVRVG